MFKKPFHLYFMFLLVTGCQTLPPAQSPISENTTGILSKTTIIIEGNQLENYALRGLTGDKNYYSSVDAKEYQVMGSNIFIKGTPIQSNTSVRRVSWLNERFSSEQNEEYLVTKNNKDDYVLKLDIKTNTDVNILSGLSALLLFTPQLVGVPEWVDVTVSISADLVTKYGTPIKTYTSQGTTQRDIAGIFYGYDISDAFAKSQQESFNEAFVNLMEQINSDKNVKQEAQKNLGTEKKAVSELKNITNGKKIYDMRMEGRLSRLEKGSIIYFYDGSFPSYYGTYYEKVGLFSGQNVYNGNLADYYFMNYRYGYSGTDSEKVFLYGKNDYVDGKNIEGYYKYVDDFTYTTILGIRKTVPAFRKITIRKELEKYFKFVNN